MDGDWGNIVYLILMALFVIVGALKKKKKPIENAEAERAEDDAPVGIENLFDTILGENSFAPQQEQPYPFLEEEIVKEEEIMSKHELPTESVKYDTPLIMEVADLSDDMDNDDESEEFDWRQAIISKEILDRKYI